MVDLTFVYYLKMTLCKSLSPAQLGKGPFTKLWARAKLLKDWEKDYFGTRSDADRRSTTPSKTFRSEHRVRFWSPRENLCHRRRHSVVVSE